jgi:hypothetical protein
MAAEVSFKRTPTRFTIFLVGEPNAFPFIVRWHLPSVTRLLVASAGDEGESEFMVVQERENREQATNKRVERRAKDGGHGRERRKKAKKHFRGEGGRFGKSQQKLAELATASDVPSLLCFHSLRSLFISVALATVALGA